MNQSEPFKRIRQYIEEAAEIERAERRLREQRDTLDRAMGQWLAGYLLPIYSSWQPTVGDAAYYVDLMGSIYLPVVVRDVKGSYVRTQASHSSNHTAFYSVDLNLAVEDYAQGACLLPPAIFETFRDAFSLRLAPFA